MALTLRCIALSLIVMASGGCFYTSGTVNLLELERQGLTLAKSDKKDPSLKNLGRVRASARSYLFGSCDATATRALEALLAKGRRTGANRVTGIRFRGHWYWMSEPVCRRNVNYVLLIVPAFLPVPTSVTVSGIAVHDAGFSVDTGSP
jgi:hypothetical protein